MRGWIIGIAVVAALSVVKIHSFRDSYGKPASQIVLRTPLKPIFDSPNAECLRAWSAGIPTCLAAYERSRSEAIRLIDIPFCASCANLAESIAGSGLAEDVRAGRIRDIREASAAI